jgi:hypothetical protein
MWPTLLTSDDGGTTWANHPDRLWVEQLYPDLLGRAADTAGTAYWLGVLAKAPALPAVPLGIEETAEFRDEQVSAMYQQLLERPADPAGLQWLATSTANGATYEQVEAALLGSDEYFERRGDGTDTGWLTAVYADVFDGRSVDPGAATYWLGELSHESRESVALDLVESTEGLQDRVQAMFQAYLHRPGDSGGVSYWASQIQVGVRDESVVAQMVISSEYYTSAAAY